MSRLNFFFKEMEYGATPAENAKIVSELASRLYKEYNSDNVIVMYNGHGPIWHIANDIQFKLQQNLFSSEVSFFSDNYKLTFSVLAEHFNATLRMIRYI